MYTTGQVFIAIIIAFSAGALAGIMCLAIVSAGSDDEY